MRVICTCEMKWVRSNTYVRVPWTGTWCEKVTALRFFLFFSGFFYPQLPCGYLQVPINFFHRFIFRVFSGKKVFGKKKTWYCTPFQYLNFLQCLFFFLCRNKKRRKHWEKWEKHWEDVPNYSNNYGTSSCCAGRLPSFYFLCQSVGFYELLWA
jgi:hypothetical protein